MTTTDLQAPAGSELTEADQAPPDPETVLQELNTAANAVRKASAKLGRVLKAFEGAMSEDGEVQLGVKARYEIAVDEALMEIVDNYEGRDKRPPAEDVRMARARRQVRRNNESLYVAYLQGLVEIKALRQWISGQKQIVSAKQTVLNGLKDMGA